MNVDIWTHYNYCNTLLSLLQERMSDPIKDFKMHVTGSEDQVTFPSAILENFYMKNDVDSFPTTKKAINTSTEIIKTLSAGLLSWTNLFLRVKNFWRGCYRIACLKTFYNRLRFTEYMYTKIVMCSMGHGKRRTKR